MMRFGRVRAFRGRFAGSPLDHCHSTARLRRIADNFRRKFCRRCAQGKLGITHLLERHAVEKFAGQCQQYGNLPGHGHRCEFRLFETGSDALPCSMILRVLSSSRVPKRAKVPVPRTAHRRVLDRPPRRDRPHAVPCRRRAKRICRHRRREGCPVRTAWAQGRSVRRDGDQVGGNVAAMFCASVSMIGSAVSEPPPSFVAQMRGALQQPRVDVKDVAGIGFATGRRRSSNDSSRRRARGA